tara:strand:+ start:437 stop:625 length:189 start_codon:yes stop_codon:yes gene_type:complete
MRAGYNEADQAFDNAIAEGTLSGNTEHPQFAGYYMYMGKDESGNSLFKHKMTRQYIATDSEY